MIGSTTRRSVCRGIAPALVMTLSGIAFAAPEVSATRAQPDNAQTPEGITPEQAEQMRAAMEARRAAATGSGEIIFINDHVDMGDVLDSDTAAGEYRFKNVGPGPVSIVRIKPDCGCTLASVHRVVTDDSGEEGLIELDPKDQSTMVFEEGELGVIKTTYDAKNRWGHANKKIAVTTNNPKKQNMTVSLSVNVIPVVPVEPRIVTFGNNIFKGTSAVRELKVYGRTEDFEATGATFQAMALHRNIKIEIVGTEESEYQGEKMRCTTLRMTTSKDLKPGALNDTLHVRTNDPRRPLVEVQVIGKVLGDLSVTPPLMRFGHIGTKDPVERKMQITSRSGSAFKVEDVKAHSDLIDLEWTAEPGDPENPNLWVVYFKVKASGVDDPASRVSGRVFTVITDVQDEEEIPVTAYGIIRKDG